MKKDRFEDKQILQQSADLIRTTAAKTAITYWIVVLLTSSGLWAAGFDLATYAGAAPIVLLTLPWSLLLIKVAGALSSSGSLSPALLHKVESARAIFVLLAIFCGGLNAAVLFGMIRTVQNRRRT